MPRALQFAIFLAFAATITASLHYYLWARLVRGPALLAPWRTTATWTIVGLGASMPLAIPLTIVLPPAVARVVVLPIYVWMGLMFLLVAFLAAGEVVRLASRGLELARVLSPDPGRRLALTRAIGGIAAVAALGTSAWGLHAGLRPPVVRPVEVTLPRLPPSLDGTTIVQLTDLHLGPTRGRAFAEDVVARTNALAPDLVAITGDLVDGSVAALRSTVAPLAGLRARHGVYFVTGNHEYYSGVEEWLPELERLGIRVLRNERVAIGGGPGEDGFDLAGVDDAASRGMARGHGPDLARALAGRDPARVVVLLAHQPREARNAARLRVDLQLSGHTHGGQIWPWSYLVYLQQPFVTGLNRAGDTFVYVSNGTGFWGPPMRVGAPAEITRIVLRSGGRGGLR